MLMMIIRTWINVVVLDIIINLAIIIAHVHLIIRMISTGGIHRNKDTIIITIIIIIRMISTGGIHRNKNTINITIMVTIQTLAYQPMNIIMIILEDTIRLMNMGMIAIGVTLIIVDITTNIHPVVVDMIIKVEADQVMVVPEAFTDVVN
jgi:hypothetical protein